MRRLRVFIIAFGCCLVSATPSFGQYDQPQSDSANGNGWQKLGGALQQSGQSFSQGAARINPQLQQGLHAEEERKNMQQQRENLKLENEILRAKLKKLQRENGE